MEDEFGWVKLYRKTKNWRWYKDANTSHLWMHILLSANHKETFWEKILIKPGQFICSIASLSDKTGLSPREIRTCLERLKSTNEVTSQTTTKYTIISVNSWEKYQMDKSADTVIDKQTTCDRHTIDKRTTTNKNVKKEKKEEEESKYISPEMNSGGVESEKKIKREPDPIWDALHSVYQLNPVGRSWGSRIGAVVKALKSINATPFGIFISRWAYEAKCPGQSLPSPEKLAERWYRETTEWAKSDGREIVKSLIREKKIQIPYEKREF